MLAQRTLRRVARGSAYSCPIALAVPRSNSNLSGVVVASEICVQRRGEQFHADLPMSAVSFIEQFDMHEPVSPFKFYAHFVPDDRGENEEEGDE